MAFRVIMIENELTMKLKLNNFIVRKDEKDIWIPLSDISMIIVDNLKVSITARMLSAFSEYNVGLIICNQEHLPIGYYSSYDNHSRGSKIINYQINKSTEFYSELWRKIICSKLYNQSDALTIIGKSDSVSRKIKLFAEEVEDNDASNREAHAAKIYFNEMMGTSFSRGNEDILLNSGLDYGYSIVRSCIARVCVGHGLNTQIGIHHKNEYNRFNLVDDLIEPLRPIVDVCVYRLLDGEQYFKPEHRRTLVNILNHKILYKEKEMYIGNMIEEYIGDIVNYITGKKEEILFPEVKMYISEYDDEI